MAKIIYPLLVVFFFFNTLVLKAEGSIDFINYDGYRLFLRTDVDQQIKVFANAGEFLNIGSSHIGLNGGFIEVYRPDGSLETIFDGSNGDEAIIYNNIQELNGPTGGAGYIPGVIPVTSSSEGIWTVIFKHNQFTGLPFGNILNNAPWTRENNQPDNQRVILSWDVTVSQNSPGNQNGNLITGRVFANEYNTMINGNGFLTSPTYYVLTFEGVQYKVDFLDTDPYGFPLTSSSTGIQKGDGLPTYKSWDEEDYIITGTHPSTWNPDSLYQYTPQAQDTELNHNNKIFFNIPDSNMPSNALTTDIFRENTYTTWLFSYPEAFQLDFSPIYFSNAGDEPCSEFAVELGGGVNFPVVPSLSGIMELRIDIDNNGSNSDLVDVVIFDYVNQGGDSLFWDLKDGQGNYLEITDNYEFGFSYRLRRGECHMLFSDVENNYGGVTFEMISDIGAIDTDVFYYDHSNVDGPVSGGGFPGNAQPTNEPFVYDSLFGNKKLLDYWTFVVYGQSHAGNIIVDIVNNCNENSQDTDNDGIPDAQDLDDDNDGLPDSMEYCNGNGFDCLPGGFDPSGDEDTDGVFNYLDSNDSLVNINCIDVNTDGICDNVLDIFDTDGDGVPNHLDLDSDNDGISDLFEAGHGEIDLDNNGILDGDSSLFGENGFFNTLASDPDAQNAIAIYTPWDFDEDGILGVNDLDSDNDGINDLLEAGYGYFDQNNDGIIDTIPLLVDSNGLAISLNGIVFSPVDSDGDDLPDFHDLDSDSDTISDVVEGGNLDPDDDGLVGEGSPIINENGQPTGSTSDPLNTDDDDLFDFLDIDSDNDGLPDEYECPNDTTCVDTDGDGSPDFQDTDSDADGIPDEYECPTGTACVDTDGDGSPDFQDTDSDADGIPDEYECPTGTVCVDTDGDGSPDFQDTDSDADGIPDEYECPTGTVCIDTDGDGSPDFQDTDSDADGIPDEYECPTGTVCIDTDGDGSPDFQDTDSDADGIPDEYECPTGTVCVDTDGDGSPDFQDTDSDADGIPDEYECPTGTVCIDTDGDGSPDFQDTDSDADGIPDEYECPTGTVCIDTDGDGSPDFQDTDSDADGIPDEYECPTGTVCIDTDGDGSPDFQDTDSDADGIPDEYECPTGTVCVDTDGDGSPDFQDTDSDADGIPDEYECPTGTVCVDTDGDGSPDFQDTDSDADGIPDEYECPTGTVCIDTDGDGSPDFQDTDSDADGIPDEYECPTGTVCIDTDGDGSPDFQDTDSDADGIPDEYECPTGTVCVDTDGDGSPDFQDTDSDADGIPDEDECPEGIPCPDDDGDGIPEWIDPYIECETELVITELTGAGTYCQGISITLNGSTNLEEGVELIYTWTGPLSFSYTAQAISGEDLSVDIITASTLAEGPYTLYVETFEGCTAIPMSILVNIIAQPESPGLSVLDDTVCLGETLTLNASPATGENPVYQWYVDTGNGAELISETVVPTLFLEDATTEFEGNYSVLVFDGECTSGPSNIIDVAVITLPENIEAVNISNGQSAACEGSDVILNVPYFPGADYFWFGPNGQVGTTQTLTLEDVSSNEAGEYYAIINFDECGEVYSLPTTVFVNEINIEPILSADNDELCVGEDVLLTIVNDLEILPEDAVSFVWYNATTNTEIETTSEPSINLENLDSSAEYVVIVVLNDCEATSEAYYISVNAIPNEVATIPLQSILICEGEETFIQAVAPLESEGRWTSLGEAIVLNPNNSTSIVTNLAAGVNAFVWSLSSPDCDVFSTDTIYVSEAASFNAENDVYTIEQNTRLTEQNITLNDMIGSLNNLNFEITSEPLNGEVIDLGNGIITYIPNADFVGEDVFYYTICNRDCEDACDEGKVTIIIKNSNVSDDCFIPNGITPNGDGSNDALMLPCLDDNQYPNNNIMIFNRWGDKVYDAAPYNNDWKGTYKSNQLPAGTYFFILKMEEGSNPIQEFFTIVY